MLLNPINGAIDVLFSSHSTSQNHTALPQPHNVQSMVVEGLPDYVDSDEILPEWTGNCTVSYQAEAVIQSLLKNAILKAKENLADDLFYLSPLTSPDSSSPSTPAPALSLAEPQSVSSMTSSLTTASAIFSLSPLSSLEHTGTSSPAAHPAQHSATLSAELLSAKLEEVARTPPPPKQRALHALTLRQVKREKSGKERSKSARKQRRQDAGDSAYGNRPLPEDTHQSYATSADPIYTDTDTKNCSVASTAFVGLDQDFPATILYLEDLIVEGSKVQFDLKKWDGRTPAIIVDRDGRLIAVLAGRPDDSGWEDVTREAARLLEDARLHCRVPKKSQHHRRGAFTTLRCGFSHGGGQTQPQNLFNTKRNGRVIRKLNKSKAMRRIAGFGSSVFQSWAPQLHGYYVEKLGALQRHDPTLKRPFRNSVFSSTTYNLGPKTVCKPHIDFANLPFGFCAITALGDFDPRKGGHILLWECRLAIEFPPGSTILIPSAIIHHSNVPIADGEVRYSVTQYVAGGLIRWVDHNFQLTEEHRASLMQEELGELDIRNKGRWAMGLSLMPRIPAASTS